MAIRSSTLGWATFRTAIRYHFPPGLGDGPSRTLALSRWPYPAVAWRNGHHPVWMNPARLLNMDPTECCNGSVFAKFAARMPGEDGTVNSPGIRGPAGPRVGGMP